MGTNRQNIGGEICGVTNGLAILMGAQSRGEDRAPTSIAETAAAQLRKR